MVPATQPFFNVVQCIGDFVSQRPALGTSNEVLIIALRKIDAATRALPEDDGLDVR